MCVIDSSYLRLRLLGSLRLAAGKPATDPSSCCFPCQHFVVDPSSYCFLRSLLRSCSLLGRPSSCCYPCQDCLPCLPCHPFLVNPCLSQHSCQDLPDCLLRLSLQATPYPYLLYSYHPYPCLHPYPFSCLIAGLHRCTDPYCGIAGPFCTYHLADTSHRYAEASS